MKRILIAAHHYPPDAAVGAIRPAKFAKYLPQYGWTPLVLTVRDSYYATVDRQQPASDVEVIRTRYVRNPNHYYRALKRRLIGQLPGQPASEVTAAEPTDSSGMGLLDWINTLLAFPDEDTGWLPFALARVESIVRRQRIDCVLTSGPPHSTHLIGAWLKRRYGHSWIADLRDPLHFGSTPWLQRQSARAETGLIERADRVLTTTRRLSVELASTHPDHAHKVRTITNGFDPDDYQRKPRQGGAKFMVSYLGSLYLNRDPEPILRAVAQLIASGDVDRNRIVIRFIGDCEDASGKAMRPLVSQFGLDGVVQIEAWLPKRQAFDVMEQSHTLLLLAENQALMIPAKVYDYIGSGRSILAITGDGATADLLKDVPSAVVLDPADEDGLTMALRRFYREYLTEPLQSRVQLPDALEAFSRPRLSADLAELLTELAVPNNAR